MPDWSISTGADPTSTAAVIAEVTRLTGCTDLMVIGAAARDLHAAAQGRRPSRATHDLDLTFAVAGWDEYRRIADALGGSSGPPHRFTVLSVPVDLVPSGPIGDPSGAITWPDGAVMNTSGLDAARASASRATLSGGVAVWLPTVPALAGLKILAWTDRHLTTTRDAVDLATYLDWATGPEEQEVVYGDHGDLLERYDWDPEPAAIHLFGRAIRADLADAADLVAEVLVRESGPLGADMGESLTRRRTAQITALLAGVGAP
jgi:predicted nucleotidyltransferase